jgi:hypothetical protein
MAAVNDPLEQVGCVALTVVWTVIGVVGLMAFGWRQWAVYIASALVVGWGYGRFVQSRRDVE